jgi:rare lipoprotein A
LHQHKNINTLLILFFFIASALRASGQEETGICSFYGNKFHGRRTAGGEVYNRYAYTAAHRTLPFNTFVEVTNLSNGKKVIVRINDRGPHSRNRIIDVSRAAAEDLEMIPSGVVKVSIAITSESPPPDKPGPPPARGDVSKNDKSAPELAPGYVYDKELKKVAAMGFGVHAGSYRHLKPCVGALLRLEKKFGISCYIFVRSKGNAKNYVLVAGDYDSRNSALLLQEKLIKESPGSYVVEWKALLKS